MGAGAWSAPEARAAGVLRRARGVPPFEQNAWIGLPDGSWLCVDFLWRELRAVLEIDSVEHHDIDPADRDHTNRRASTLHTFGYTTISRRPSVINRQPAQFAADVAQWLDGRRRELAARAV